MHAAAVGRQAQRVQGLQSPRLGGRGGGRQRGVGQGGTQGAVPAGVDGGCVATAELGVDGREPTDAERVAGRQPDDVGFPAQQELRPAEFEGRDVEVDLKCVGRR